MARTERHTYNCGAAGILAYGATAAEEGNHEYDAANDYDANRYGSGIERVAERIKGSHAIQHDRANYDEQNTCSLEIYNILGIIYNSLYIKYLKILSLSFVKFTNFLNCLCRRQYMDLSRIHILLDLTVDLA